MSGERTVDLTLCDREPIHIPGSIQPHGLMLVCSQDLIVRYAAGDVEAALGRAEWLGKPLASLIGEAAAAQLNGAPMAGTRAPLARILPPFSDLTLDVATHRADEWLILELEPVERGEPLSSELLLQIEASAGTFERTHGLEQLCQSAAEEFQRLTDYDRVMVYRFLDDDSGVVVGEAVRNGMHAFLHHHFPASDIPKQARQLYVRNFVRVIPDVNYMPAPLAPDWDEAAPLDMSDCILRSVSPVHLQYMRNMQVGASASISIVKDGVLWGLIACHNLAPRRISAERRAACRALAAGLSRQIKAREETDNYRERVRLRTYEDDIVGLLSREGSLDRAVSNHLGEIMKMLAADGVAVLRGGDLVMGGRCPPEDKVRALAEWVAPQAVETVFATDRLGTVRPTETTDDVALAGLLAITLSPSDPWVVLWFRAEQVEVVNWAGNPHKDQSVSASGVLNPRASFEAWSETVRGRARRWTLPEVEAAGRLRSAVTSVWQNRRIRALNRQLLATLEEKEMLLKQKEFLIGEVNHRVQNSLQLVSSFLGLQMRASEEKAAHAAIEEARRRIGAVSLVHRRLYKADQVDAIDAARYVDELVSDVLSSLGAEWESHVVRDLQPVMLPTDRAITLGLVLTELLINVNKYAYGGAPGPLRIALTEEGNRLRLVVEDAGGGRKDERRGFGSRMMEALVEQLRGSLEFEASNPGTRAILTAPING